MINDNTPGFKRILVLATGNLNNRKGVMNVVHNRVKHLTSIIDYKVDVFLISLYYPKWLRVLSHKVRQDRPSVVSLDGVDYNIIWRPFSLVDYIMRIRLKRQSFRWNDFVKKSMNRFCDYDLVDCHSFQSGEIAHGLKKKYGTPYIITWHGSDIHTDPFKSPKVFTRTRYIIENANCNFFVSQDLLNTSSRITPRGVKMVLYNAMDKRFFQYDKTQKEQLQKLLHVEGKRVVTFCGNLLPVKNTVVIPPVFRLIYDLVPNVLFWVIGDGECKKSMQAETKGLPITFWGNQPPEAIPDYMNVTDVLVLPSKNEGLPLVIVEALSCGCHVVGSRVGGIPEVIGYDNTVPLSHPHFEEEFAKKVVSFLLCSDKTSPCVPDCFDWDITALKEKEIICSILQ